MGPPATPTTCAPATEPAKGRGVILGHPRKLTEQQIEHARREIEKGGKTIAHMARTFGVAPITLSRALNRTG